jgi:radical SAM superfamily enzyme YgiQ (UPF0313 family)
MSLGLYLHIPFCASICNYCNFNRGLFESGLKDRYVAALEQEIRQSRAIGDAAASGGRADTIFFGGGTPSLLEPAEIARLVRACRETFDVARDAEVTLETNPETSAIDRMEGFRDAGVTRISFGVQSFREAELKRLGRIHSADRAREAVGEARAAGFDNISLDLMMWLPQQSASDWRENVEALIEVGPEHASLYLLELYPNAPLKEDMARAGRSHPTTTRRRCISGAWRGWKQPVTGSTRSPTWPVRASRRATISNTGRTASGLDLAAAPTRPFLACGGRMSPRQKTMSFALGSARAWSLNGASSHTVCDWRKRCSPGSA